MVEQREAAKRSECANAVSVDLVAVVEVQDNDHLLGKAGQDVDQRRRHPLRNDHRQAGVDADAAHVIDVGDAPD